MHAVFLPLILSLYKQECGRSNLVDRSHALIIVKVISNKYDFCNEPLGGEEREELREKHGPAYLEDFLSDDNVCQSPSQTISEVLSS